MKAPSPGDIAALLKQEEFDAEWYLKAYPDTQALGMEPAYHYLAYGHRMGRDPGPNFSTAFARFVYRFGPETEPLGRLQRLAANIEPDRNRVLIAAHEIARQGNGELAIRLAERHLPAELAHTVNVLRSNVALATGNEEDWLGHLNAYLRNYSVAPITLEGEGNIYQRLACAPLEPVTGGPLVSVIMPAWNAERTVTKAVNSILNQTWRNLELLIVDDASTDGTWKVLQELVQRDDRIKLLRNKVNAGPYVSKNIALTVAKGMWITGHDADDWAHPQRLEQHLKMALEMNCDASLTYMLRIKPNGLFDHFTPINDFSPDGVARMSMISTLFNHDLLKHKLGFWDSVRFGADSEMASRARRLLGNGFRNIPTIGMLCLDTEDSLTNDPATGIRTQTGLSPLRTAYKRAWQEQHKVADQASLYLPFPQITHRYPGDFEHFVRCDSISKICDVQHHVGAQERAKQ